MGLEAGELNQRIVFQRNYATVDDEGQKTTESWSDFYECSASVKGRASVEFNSSLQVQSDASHEVIIRYNPESRSIIARDRFYLKETGQIFEIDGPPLDQDYRHEAFVINARRTEETWPVP